MRLLAGYVAFVAVWTLAADLGVAPRFPMVINGVFVGDKIIHFTVVGGFALVLSRAISQWGWGPLRAVLSGMAIAATLATVEELTNLLTPHRGFSYLDMAANCSGVLVVTTLGWLAGVIRQPGPATAAPSAQLTAQLAQQPADLLLPTQLPQA